jgi:hypothetical protein
MAGVKLNSESRRVNSFLNDAPRIQYFQSIANGTDTMQSLFSIEANVTIFFVIKFASHEFAYLKLRARDCADPDKVIMYLAERC